MVKNNAISTERDSQKAWIVKRVAMLHGVSERYVYKVINGERENEDIFTSYMEILQGSNALVKEVEKLVPFNNPKAATA